MLAYASSDRRSHRRTATRTPNSSEPCRLKLLDHLIKSDGGDREASFARYRPTSTLCESTKPHNRQGSHTPDQVMVAVLTILAVIRNVYHWKEGMSRVSRMCASRIADYQWVKSIREDEGGFKPSSRSECRFPVRVLPSLWTLPSTCSGCMLEELRSTWLYAP